MNFKLPPIYPITDASISGIPHDEQVQRLIAGGARFIQIREKNASPRDFYESVVKTVKIAKRHGVKLIINDRVDIALAAKADGVHLGQDDMPPQSAREILGPDAIIGYSTHSIEQARTALSLPVDYIAIGPIFQTTTKLDHDDVVGLDGLKAVRSAIGNVPLVAIGGITAANLASVFAAGANTAAMIGPNLSEYVEIESKMRDFIIQMSVN